MRTVTFQLTPKVMEALVDFAHNTSHSQAMFYLTLNVRLTAIAASRVVQFVRNHFRLTDDSVECSQFNAPMIVVKFEDNWIFTVQF